MTTLEVSAKVVRSVGPLNSPIAIVGDYPSASDLQQHAPFSDNLGLELGRILHDAGELFSNCRLLCIAQRSPPRGDISSFFVKKTKANIIPTDELSGWIMQTMEELDQQRPRVIFALGELSLWALTGQSSIVDWRGSEIEYEYSDGSKGLIIPTFSPAQIMRQWSWRYLAVADIRRGRRYLTVPYSPPAYDFLIRPSFTSAMERLKFLETQPRIACDIETAMGHITCVGLAWSSTEAICIPLTSRENHEGYWNLAEETAIILQIQKLFSLPTIEWIFQNGLYDLQYFARHWGIIPRVHMDTMLAHHVCFAGLPKGLDFLSSLYCEKHKYWKNMYKSLNSKAGEV